MSILTEVALEDAAVAVKLIIRQPRGQEVRGLEAGPGVVTNYLRKRKHVYMTLSMSSVFLTWGRWPALVYSSMASTSQ